MILEWVCRMSRSIDFLFKKLTHSLRLYRKCAKILLFHSQLSFRDGIYCGPFASVGFTVSVLGPGTERNRSDT